MRYLAIASVSLLLGCAATARDVAPRAGAAAAAVADSVVVADFSLRRSAELADSRGALRVFHQDVRLEFRAGGRGLGLDAGEVTLDGRPLRREAARNGAVNYRGGRDGHEKSGENPWITLANTGAAVPADTVRVRIAAFPVVTHPIPRQALQRGEDIMLFMLPPVAGVWQRASLVGAGDTVNGLDMGEGRWLFPRGSLERVGGGAARLVVEIETSCAACPAGPRLRATWSTRAELEIPVTLF